MTMVRRVAVVLAFPRGRLWPAARPFPRVQTVLPEAVRRTEPAIAATTTERGSAARVARVVTLVLVAILPGASAARAQPVPGAQATVAGPDGKTDTLSAAAAKVDVTPAAHDGEIERRLQKVLVATRWFTDPKVRVQDGVVFLTGGTESDALKKWASDLARNTQDVVAVVNRIEVVKTSAWDLAPAWNGLATLWRELVRALPFVIFGLFVLALSVGAGLLATSASRTLLRSRITGPLLRNVVARAIGLLVVLTGTYIVLRISGLTQLALTIVGSTGVIGLALGIAFRDITENFLASIFLSMQRPFQTGDLVEITNVTGYVQQLNVRATILMTLDGNLVQIPNATVYKTNLRNFTTNTNRREDFVVGIGYDDSISDAQEIARNVLTEHPAVLKDPEPSVLVDGLGASTVQLRIYFWLNGREHSWLKVRSSVIRLVKVAFQKNGISMPDVAREVIFPRGVPVTMIEAQTAAATEGKPSSAPLASDDSTPSTRAEAGLYSEAEVIEEQARRVGPLNQEENLLRDPEKKSAAGDRGTGAPQ